MSRLKLKLSFLFALAGLAVSPANTFAGSFGFDEPPARVVKFRDLDLSQKAGVATLYSRIRSAAHEVCEPLDEVSIKLLRQRFDCRQDAVARAVADVNSPALTSYYLGKGKSKSLAANQAQ
jgi:UrcA family protein